MIRILLAEDQHLIRGALLALIGLEDDMEVVAQLDSGDAVTRTARELRPDVAILDIDLPGIDGLAAAVALRDELPDTHVLILTGLNQPGYLRRALEAKVTGFMRKSARSEELADAIRRVSRGSRFIDPDLVSETLDLRPNPLSERESDVLRPAAATYSTAQISLRLFLSQATVRNYVSNAMTKLDARNRIDASRIAREAGWI